MKCQNLIPKNKKPTQYNTYYLDHLEDKELYYSKTDLSNHKVCGGKIKAEIKAIDEPTWGGSYASLEIKYTCEKCKSVFHPYLPNEYNINDFLTKKIEEMK